MLESSLSADDFLTPSSNDSTDSVFDRPINKKQKIVDKSIGSERFCHICKQNVLDPKTKSLQSLPNAVLEEEAALTDDRLLLYCDGELIPESDIKPLHKITHFTVFDGEGHLCPFDSGLIENGELIFFSGYIKPISDDDPSPANGVPVQELGPILEWWISGFDGGNSFIVAFSTPYAEYILMEPSFDYSFFMRMPNQKALLTKIVIEFLGTSETPTYEELLTRISEVSVPKDIEPLDEHWLGKHAQFIIDQIQEVDDKKKLISTPAAQDMIRKFNVSTKTTRSIKKCRFKSTYRPTTTPLVSEKFKFFFNREKAFVKSPEREQLFRDKAVFPTISKKLSQFSWEESWDFALVNDEIISIKNFVFINTKTEKASRIFRIEYFFQQNFTKQAHCMELIKGTDTVLGDASYPNEFFFLEECSNWPICKIITKADVVIKEPPKKWKKFLNYKMDPPEDRFFVQKKYLQQHGIFEDFIDSKPGTCGVCVRREEVEKANTPTLINGRIAECGRTIYEKVVWRNEEYSPGCCVFLEPFSVVFDAQKSSRRIEKTLVTVKTDEIIYPELYRKAKELILTEECPEPFVVGFIKNVFSRSEGPKKKLFLTINKFYRPENTRILKASDKRLLDLQLLFWSNEETEVLFDHVRGRCDVVFSKTPPVVGIHPQFYFNSTFDCEKETFSEMDEVSLKMMEKEDFKLKKLKTLNAFSGCGGLAEGLRQSGISEILWAVEIDKSTCRAFKSNFPKVVMFEKDCNLFLAEVMSGKLSDENGFRYPAKEEVEFLCGGPPCQGFSTMNRFSSKEDSQYNNSLILTFLSFCDYYRPKFFLLENVRNFVKYKKSIFLRHTLGCLVAMGYQCNFGVIQSGNYGIPQTRKRLFILAAAPGLILPDFPKPTNVFYGSLKNFEYEVNGSNFCCKISRVFSASAPYRRVTIKDAVSNLPGILKLEKSDREETYYERFLMGFRTDIRDQVCKEMSPINEARIKHIPAAKGCDWRDLPNIKVLLRDGTVTNLLRYSYHDRKNGKSSCGLLRGVCGCASGKQCDVSDRQNNTLIPWFLVHTANRNNNWNGLYGRLDFEGIFNTVTTSPEPSGQQGKVLHPEENRTISVRESARAQGLPDSFRLFGTVAERYKQVGNAVPSPVARALASEIGHSLLLGDSD